jgi:Tol biopolymer transport system component
MDESGNGQLLAEFDDLEQLSWSPDGRRVAFSDGGRLCILAIDNLSQACPLEETLPASDFGSGIWRPPAWSPDGQWLAFQATKRYVVQCVESYLLNLLTNEVVSLEVRSCGATPFYWSPAVP